MWELAESEHPGLVKADRNCKPQLPNPHIMLLMHGSKA
jgi:hypothetical protein